MLAELVEYLLTPCSREARRLGLLREAVAIRARHARNRAAWEPHLANCRRTVLEAAGRCRGHGHAVVLGSGALLDIPLDALAGRFERVSLVDMVHPLAARWRVRGMGNVRLLETDLTGVLADLLARPGEIPDVAPRPELPGPPPDLTISACVLSQLPLAPAVWLARHGLPEAAIGAFCAGIVRAHLDLLGELPGVACLITDVERRAGDRRIDLLHGQAPPSPREWTWLIAPQPEISRDHDVAHLVRAVILPG